MSTELLTLIEEILIPNSDEDEAKIYYLKMYILYIYIYIIYIYIGRETIQDT